MYSLINKNCYQCQKNYLAKRPTQKFCSHSCRNKFYPLSKRDGRTAKCCKQCGAKFKFWPSVRPSANFCSIKCKGLSQLVHRPIKQGRYLLVHVLNHPFARKNYIEEHRFVMEKKVGRFLKKHEVVHHINGNTFDNRIENLKLFSSHTAHMIFHHPKGRPVT